MPQIIKIKCNGAGQHVNDVDLDKVLKPTVVLRGGPPQPRHIPERLVLHCQTCADGQVIVTRAMVETVQGK